MPGQLSMQNTQQQQESCTCDLLSVLQASICVRGEVD